MNITVVGCGKIGTAIIESLAAEGHNVTAVDVESELVGEVCTVYDVMGVCGNGTDCNVLIDAGVESAELFIAVTGSDEFNMLSCFLAKRLGATNTVARIRNPEYNDQSLVFLRQQLDLSFTINPERLMAEELFNIIKFPSNAKIETFAHRNYEMVEFIIREDSPLVGKSLIELRKAFKAAFLVGAVGRGDEVYIPNGEFVIESGDKICMISSPLELYKLFKSIVAAKKRVKEIMIAGGGRITYYLAKILLSAGNDVKIIERDERRCEDLSEALPKAIVINGDPADDDILLEEGIADTDAFVALTDADEENILLSFVAASHNVKKTISQVDRSAFANQAEKLGLDCVMSTKQTVANVVVWYARALENSIDSTVETLYRLMGGRVEALEFIVKGKSEITDTPLKNLKFKNNVLIAGIIRGRKPIIPSGDDVILAGDHVVVLAAGQRIYELPDVLK